MTWQDAAADELAGRVALGASPVRRLVGVVARTSAASSAPSVQSRSSASTASGANCVPRSRLHSASASASVERLAVDPARRHRVPRLGESEEPRPGRDRLAGDAVRIARAVPALVVVADPAELLLVERLDGDLGARVRMVADLLELGWRRAGRACGARPRRCRACRRRAAARPARAGSQGRRASRTRARASRTAARRVPSVLRCRDPLRRAPVRVRGAGRGRDRRRPPAPRRRRRARRCTGRWRRRRRSSRGRGRSPRERAARRLRRRPRSRRRPPRR